MRDIIESILSFFFPPCFCIVEKDQELGEHLETWTRYEEPSYSELDPFRPLGRYDSWAGNVREQR